jgi:hypothetical protein
MRDSARAPVRELRDIAACRSQVLLRVRDTGPNPGFRAAPSPESYTPKHLAEKILTSRSALEGERKVVTVPSATSSAPRRWRNALGQKQCIRS